MKNKILEILYEVKEGKRSVTLAENELSTLLYENKDATIQALTNLLKVAQKAELWNLRDLTYDKLKNIVGSI